MSHAVLLVSHGSVDSLDDLAAFVTNVRRGRAPSAELVQELRRRYECIGGSPLNAVTAEVARKLALRLSARVGWANRLWRPYVRDVLAEMARDGVKRLALVPLAQHSAHVYAADAMTHAHTNSVELAAAANWGQSAKLCDAFAVRISAVLPDAAALERTVVVMSAHSLPRSIIDAGDPYEREVRAAADAVLTRVRARTGRGVRGALAFQSQGLAGGGGEAPRVEWLGPDVKTVLDEAAGRGERHAVFAPIGFLADHVETLYDLDVDARILATERGLSYTRAASLNADDDFIEALADVALTLMKR
jgi:ferrochelatase